MIQRNVLNLSLICLMIGCSLSPIGTNMDPYVPYKGSLTNAQGKPISCADPKAMDYVCIHVDEFSRVAKKLLMCQ